MKIEAQPTADIARRAYLERALELFLLRQEFSALLALLVTLTILALTAVRC